MKNDDLKKRTGVEQRAFREQRDRERGLTAAASAPAPMSSRQERLDAYREVIVRRQRDFVETGTALGLIAKHNLFKEAGHASFEAMVIDEFDMSTSTAYRLVDAARVVTILSQVGTVETKIRNQTQALALAPLGNDREAMVLTIASAEARGKLTAELLAVVRVELYPYTKVIDGEVVPERAPLPSSDRPAIEGNPPAADPLDSIPAAKAAVDARLQAAANPSAAGEGRTSEPGTPPAGPVGTVGDGSGTQAGPGKSTADTVAGPVAGTGTADLSVPATPKDAPGMDGGQPDPVPADSPAGRDLQGPSDAKPGVANGRPETDHRDHEPGDETGPEAPSPDNASGPVAGRDPASNGFTGVRPFPVAALGKGATGGEAVGSGGDTPVLPSDPADALHAVAKLFAAIDLETYGPWQSDERIDRMSWDAQQITGAVQTIAMFQSGLTLDGSPS